MSRSRIARRGPDQITPGSTLGREVCTGSTRDHLQRDVDHIGVRGATRRPQRRRSDPHGSCYAAALLQHARHTLNPCRQVARKSATPPANSSCGAILLHKTDQLPQTRTPGVRPQTLVTAREALHNKPPPPSIATAPGRGLPADGNRDCRTASCTTTAELNRPRI